MVSVGLGDGNATPGWMHIKSSPEKGTVVYLFSYLFCFHFAVFIGLNCTIYSIICFVFTLYPFDKNQIFT